MMTPFFSHLGEEVAVEVGEAGARGVRDVDVGDLAAGHLVDFAAVAFNPGEVAQAMFRLDGDDGDIARARAVGIGTDVQHDLLAGGSFEEAVDVVGGVQIAAVDGEQILAFLHVDAGLGERGVQSGIPVFAVVDAREAVAAVVDGVVRAEQAGVRRVIGLAGTANEHVADGDFAEHFFEEVIQIVARADAVKVRLVALLDFREVEAVVVGVVEEVALDAPGFVDTSGDTRRGDRRWPGDCRG